MFKLTLPLILTLPTASAITIVLGDAYPSDGTGDFNSPSTGDGSNPVNAANAGNQVTTVYRVTDGVPGNPFNGGAAGGTFNPFVAGNVFGTDYRTTTTFDLSDIAVAPTGFEYMITSISIHFEVSSTAEQNGNDAIIDLYAGLGITTGTIPDASDATLTVPVGTTNGTFLNTALPNDSINLETDSSFTLTLDVADANQGIRLGADLHTATFPNNGINGTNFVEVAPRLVIEADLVAIPEPASSSALLLSVACMLGYRRRDRSC